MKQTVDIPAVEWRGCYDDNWNGLIVDDAFTHPAKYARGLIERIYRHMLKRDWLAKGDSVIDPFGGVALGGIIGAGFGIRWTGVELEPKFHELGNANIKLHRSMWERHGDPVPILMNGDSRRLSEIVGVADGAVSSPPYSESLHENEPPEIQYGRMKEKGHHSAIAKASRGGKFRSDSNAGYGSSSGQLGSMPEGSFDAALSSPPYSECVQGSHGERETAEETTAKRRTAGGSLGKSARHGGYGVSSGQLGAMKDSGFDAAVSSPPFENQEPSHAQGSTFVPGGGGRFVESEYGKSEGQIGNSSGDTFWSAARLIVEQVHLVLRPGAHAAWVCKDFVRKGKIVPFCRQWQAICESVGFETVGIARAMLVKHMADSDLFAGKHTTRTKERKSFFRRLAEKRGSPRIDHEEVIFVRKA